MAFSSYFICLDCGFEKPYFLRGYAGRCTVCQKKYYSRNPRAKTKKTRAKDLARKKLQPRALLRARDMWYKVHSYIPGWVRFEDVLPVYEKAEEVGGVVKHIIPLKKDPSVCGLHSPKNLYIQLKKSTN